MIFREMSACDIPDGRCGIVSFQEVIRDIFLAACSGLTIEHIRSLDFTVLVQGISHIEHR